jgi:hypothetical protein
MPTVIPMPYTAPTYKALEEGTDVIQRENLIQDGPRASRSLSRARRLP